MLIKPEHVRAALMSARGKGLKFPSIELEEYVANYLSDVKHPIYDSPAYAVLSGRESKTT